MKTILGDLYLTIVGAVVARFKFPDRKVRAAFLANHFDSKYGRYGAHVLKQSLKKALLLFILMVLGAFVVTVLVG